MPKPVSVEQKVLFDMVLGFVQKFLPDFAATDMTWVRSMKSSKFAVLNIQCRNVPIATRVQSTFAALLKSTNKPAYIEDVSISFAHTLGTRVRISLMRAISKRQKEKDPNAVCSVSAFTSRPLLRVGGKDQGTRFLSFVDAISGFRHLLTQEDLDRALSLCSGMKGKLKSKFLVLSDDRILPPYQGPKKRATQPGRQVGGNPNTQPSVMPDFNQIAVVPGFSQPPPQLPSHYQLVGQVPGVNSGIQVQHLPQSQTPLIPGVYPISTSAFNQSVTHPLPMGQVIQPLASSVGAGVIHQSQVQQVPQSQKQQVQQSQVQYVQQSQVQQVQQSQVQHVQQSQVQQVVRIPSPNPQPLPAVPVSAVPLASDAPLFSQVVASNQLQIQAEVHQALAGIPFTKVKRKRVRKPSTHPGVKRLTPSRKAKVVDQKIPKILDPLNKSENQEEFASCPSESEADITEVISGNVF